MTKVNPRHDFVLIKRLEEATTSPGGVLLPPSAENASALATGVIVAVGPGVASLMTGEVVPISIQIGDKALFSKRAGVEVKVDGEKLLLMRENELAATVE